MMAFNSAIREIRAKEVLKHFCHGLHGLHCFLSSEIGPPISEAQLTNYLKTTGLKVGLLINFGESVEIKRKVFTPLSADGSPQEIGRPIS